MRIVPSALLMLAPLASGSFLREVVHESQGRELQVLDTCNELYSDVRDTCVNMGCSCPATPPPGQCPNKAVRMIGFESVGDDPRVSDMWDGRSPDSKCPGRVCEVEFRWTVLDSLPHYPAGLDRCGPDAAVSGVPRDLNDGERYCQMYFGSRLNTGAATPRLIRNNNRPIAFRMYESDNQQASDTSLVVPFVPFQVDGFFEPSQWFNPTCATYQLWYYEYYDNGDAVGGGQGPPHEPDLCYRSTDGRPVALSIPACSSIVPPTQDYYLFIFEILGNNVN